MSITTIYRCDKCGNEQTTRKKFWNVIILVSCEYFTDSRQNQIEVCQSCFESFGIMVSEEKKKTLPPPPTVENLIREIISIVQE